MGETPFTEIATLGVKQYIDHLNTDKAANILVFYLEGEQRIIFRPSGTEPKLKIYIDCQAETQEEAKAISDQIAAALHAFVESIA